MIKCALQVFRKSTQHCPNHYLQLLFTNQINSNQMLVFDERGKLVLLGVYVGLATACVNITCSLLA